MHEHLFKKKRTRKFTLNNGDEAFSVKYGCDCGEWMTRQVKKEQKAPLYWLWEIFSDQPLKMQNIETSGMK